FWRSRDRCDPRGPLGSPLRELLHGGSYGGPLRCAPRRAVSRRRRPGDLRLLPRSRRCSVSTLVHRTLRDEPSFGSNGSKKVSVCGVTTAIAGGHDGTAPL